MSDEYTQRQFGYEYKNQAASREHVNFWGGFYEKNGDQNAPAFPALISNGTPSFEFNAYFPGWDAGHYVVRWRVKLQKGYHVSNGLRFRVSVNYGAEEDALDSLEVIIPHEEVQNLGGSHNFDQGQDLVLDLQLEELVVVQPYENRGQSGDRHGTTVVVTMSSCEGDESKYSGFGVEYVELSPLARGDRGQTVTSPIVGIRKRIVKIAMKPKFTIDATKAPRASSRAITRIAWSKDSTFLAALAIEGDIAYITVWDMKFWDPSKPGENCIVRTVVHRGEEYLEDLPIGLAISADGRQVVVYQEPMVGQWEDDSELKSGSFPLHLLTLRGVKNPSADDHLIYDEFVPHNALKTFIGYGSFLSGAYEEAEQSHSILSSLIGYGSCLSGARNSDWYNGTSNVSQLAQEDVKDNGGKGPSANAQPSNSNRQSKSSKTLFAACNGIYIDVFKAKLGHQWKHTHSIRLTDLTPTISRRITCQMMMDTISGNTFIWLEDGGVCCMLWDLRKGSNISYIAGPDNTKLGSTLYHGNSTMSISPDESMVAVASVDGTLTTFYASTGVAISIKKFTLFQIEYVAFTSQNNQLFVIIRDTITLAFNSLILDPLQLNSSMRANQVPVPVLGKTILAFFGDECFENRGFVYKTNGSEIHCYVTHEPVDNAVAKADNNLVDSTETIYPSPKIDQNAAIKDGLEADPPAKATESSAENPAQTSVAGGSVQGPAPEPEQGPVLGPMERPKDDKKYEVRTTVGKERSQDDDDLMYWILRVEVVERDLDDRNEKAIFSFVPEPWVNIPAAGFPRPKELQKVYFLTGRKRFVVVGIQTLQIWSLPKDENDHFNLVFIWSRPKVDSDQEKLNVVTAANNVQPEGTTTSSRQAEGTTTDNHQAGAEIVATAITNGVQPEMTKDEKGKKAKEMPKEDKKEPIKEKRTTKEERKAKEEKDKEEKAKEEKQAKEDRKAREAEGAAAARKAADEKETSSRKTIETEIVGNYYHHIKDAHIHLDPSTGNAKAHIKLKGGSGTDVNIPGEESSDVDSTFFNCARSIHLLAASYAYSTQENKNFLRVLDRSRSLTPKEHAEAIARFTRGHINRLLPSQYFNPLSLDDEFHASSRKASQALDTQLLTSRPQGTPGHPSTEQEPCLTSSAQALDLATLNRSPMQGLTTTQRSGPTPSAQTLKPTTLHRDPSRGSAKVPSNVGPPRNILVALGGDPSADQKLGGQPHNPPTSSAQITQDRKKGFTSSVMDAQKDEDANPDDIFTVLTLLLDQSDLRDANHVFVEGLFKTDGHEWIPHPSVALNPIKRMIKIRNEELLKVLIGYCVKNAQKLHPGYLTPVMQCLSGLSEGHSDIVSDLFRKASYIRARNPKYVASNAIVANLRFSDWTNFKKGLSRILDWIKIWFTRSPDTNHDESPDIYHYERPVFSLRSQLPFYNYMGIIRTVLRLDLSRREKRFPQGKNNNQRSIAMHQSMDIYVSPFQFKSTKGLDGQRNRSFLAEISGKDYFDSPAMEASLWYRWNMSGLYFWSAHFIVLLIFFISVLTITGQQIHVSKLPPNNEPPSDAETEARYLPGWQPAFYLTITIGIILTMYELLQLRFSTWRYFLSPYNYVHLAAYITPVIGCFNSLDAKPGIKDDTKIDGGPRQVWILAFAILLLYLNIIFELRIIKPLGRAVNIIINIAKKIMWFLFIFAVFLMSFTHALLYVLHTRRYRPCEENNKEEDGSCKGTDYPTKYPSDFFEALTTTYFFMSGRYGPVEDSFETGTVGFRFMMVIFFFFTVILLLNVLIALVNDAFSSSETEGTIAYWKLLSEVIAEMEMIPMYSAGGSNNDSNFEYIYYCATEEQVKKFESKSEISCFAESSHAAHKQTQDVQHTIIKSIGAVQLGVGQSKDDLKKEIDDLKELVLLLGQKLDTIVKKP